MSTPRNARRSRLAVVTAAATAGMLLLAACSSSSSSSGGSGAAGSGTKAAAGAAPSTVTFADILPSAPFAAEYAARGTTGAFAAVEKKFHTKIAFTTVATPQDSAQAMLGGSADVSFAGLFNYLILKSKGKGVAAMFAPFVGGGGVIIGAKKYQASRGTDLAKFSGATFGYTKEGSASQLYMRSFVQKSGLNWAKVSHVAFGTPSAGLPLLEAGRLAVAAVDPTSAAKAIAAGKAYLILNFNDKATAGPIANQLGTVYSVTTAFAAKYPDLTRALVQAMLTGLKAVQAVADDPSKVLALFPSDIQSKLSDGWAGSWALSKPGVLNSTGAMTPAQVQDSVSFTQSAGLLTPAQAALAPKVVTNQYVQ